MGVEVGNERGRRCLSLHYKKQSTMGRIYLDISWELQIFGKHNERGAWSFTSYSYTPYLCFHKKILMETVTLRLHADSRSGPFPWITYPKYCLASLLSLRQFIRMVPKRG